MAKTRWIVQSSHFALAQECASTLSAPEAPEVVHSLRASLAHLIVSTGLETTAFFFLKAGAAAGSDEAEAGSGFSAHDFMRFAGGFRDRGVAIVTQAAGSAPCLFRTQAHVKLLLATLVEQEHPQVREGAPCTFEETNDRRGERCADC
jgi:hypothetical protein